LKALVIDLLARAMGKRYTSYDVVGIGPRLVTGLINQLGEKADLLTYEDLSSDPSILENYDVILLSAMSSDRGALKNVIRLANTYGSEQLKIIGGPISFEFYDILEYMGGDIVVVGEGENQLIKLFTEYKKYLIQQDLDKLTEITGLAIKINKKIVFTGYPEYTSKDLFDKIKPYTQVNKVYKRTWMYRFYVEVVRGCSNFYRPLINIGYGRNCIKCMNCRSNSLINKLWCPKHIPPGCGFCSVPFHFGPPRSRSIKSIINEIKDLVRYGAKRIVLSAPDFLDYGREELVKPYPLTDPCNPKPNYNALENLLSRLHEIPEIYSGETRIFIENVKACLIDENVSSILGKYVHGTTIHIGLETVSRKYNETIIGKPIGLKEALQAIKILRENGLRPYIYLIYGLPFMDYKIYKKTIKALKKLYDSGVEKITLYKFVPLPMTAFEYFKPEIDKYKSIIEKYKSLVNKYNLLAKRKYFLGKKIKAYIIKEDHKLYGYPVDHGPVIFIRKTILDLKDDDVCLANIEIINVKARYVSGNIINIEKCMYQ